MVSNQLTLYAIIIFGIFLRIVFFAGYVGGDDSAYIAHAFAYSLGDSTPPYSHWGTRALIVLPTAAAFSVFGVSEIAAVALPLFLSIGCIYLAFLLGKESFNENVGIVAAFLASIFPMEVLFATQLFPYSFLSFLCTASFYTYLRGISTASRKMFLISGLLLGAAALCRITALYCLLFFVLEALFYRRIPPNAPVFAAGLAAVAALDVVFYTFLAGDPFYRLSVLANKSQGPSISGNFVPTLKWFLEPWLRPISEQEFALFFPLMVWAALWSVLRRTEYRDSVLRILIWVVPLYLYTYYGPTSPSGYSPLSRFPRYSSIVILPWLVLLGFVLSRLKSRTLAIAIQVVLAITSILAVYLDNSRSMMDQNLKLHSFVVNNPNHEIIVPRSLYYDLLFHNDFRPFAHVKPFVLRNDVSDEIKRIFIVQPNTVPIYDLSDRCFRYIVHDKRYSPPEWDAISSAITKTYVLRNQETFLDRIKGWSLTQRLLNLVRGDQSRKGTARDTERFTVNEFNHLCN